MKFSSIVKYAQNPIQEEDPTAEAIANSGKKVLKLNRGDTAAYFPTPEYIIDSYVNALRSGKTGYSSPIGIKELREAVSKRYKRMYNVDVNPSDVIVTQGVSEALLFVNLLFLNKGDKAVIFRPYYPLYHIYSMMFGGNNIYENYVEEDGWEIDTDKLEGSVKKEHKAMRRARYLLITNPSNPTGTVLNRKTLEEIVDIANNYNLMLISDEIYDEIVYNGASFTSISEIAQGVPHIILNGASKNFDATGFRIGFMIFSGRDKYSKLARDKCVELARVRLSSNTPAQYAAAEAMSNIKEHSKAIKFMNLRIEEQSNAAVKILNKSGYMKAVEPRGAFYIFPRIDFSALDIRNDKEFVHKLLLEENVHTTRGSGFGSNGHIRIVTLPDKKSIIDASEKIVDFCERHSK